MPPKRKAAAGVSAAVKKVKKATTATLSAMEINEMTKNVTREVSKNMERKIEEMMTNFGSRQTLPTAEVNVQRNVEQITEQIQGIDDAHATSEGSNPEVLVAKTITVNKVKNQSDFVSCSLKTGSNVSDKIKNQIWAGKYIEFQFLIDNEENKFKFQLEMGSDNPELSLVQEKHKKPLSLSQWLFAWNKFTAIVCTKIPELGSMLPHHLELILEMSKEGGNWYYYDIEFRKLIEKGEAKWGSTHLELYLRAKLQVRSSNNNLQNVARSTSSQRWPNGACFSFHRGIGCKFGDKCRYQHKCFNCGFNHSFSACKKPVSLPYRFTKSSNNFKSQGLHPFRGEVGKNGPTQRSDKPSVPFIKK